eukprot:m.203972 g.203972  ORF g.203972 m.203972 type:complete len:305 (+) comp10695_c2_seq1:11268-12182(+)
MSISMAPTGVELCLHQMNLLSMEVYRVQALCESFSGMSASATVLAFRGVVEPPVPIPVDDALAVTWEGVPDSLQKRLSSVGTVFDDLIQYQPPSQFLRFSGGGLYDASGLPISRKTIRIRDATTGVILATRIFPYQTQDVVFNRAEELPVRRELIAELELSNGLTAQEPLRRHMFLDDTPPFFQEHQSSQIWLVKSQNRVVFEFSGLFSEDDVSNSSSASSLRFVVTVGTQPAAIDVLPQYRTDAFTADIGHASAFVKNTTYYVGVEAVSRSGLYSQVDLAFTTGEQTAFPTSSAVVVGRIVEL